MFSYLRRSVQQNKMLKRIFDFFPVAGNIPSAMSTNVESALISPKESLSTQRQRSSPSFQTLQSASSEPALNSEKSKKEKSDESFRIKNLLCFGLLTAGTLAIVNSLESNPSCAQIPDQQAPQKNKLQRRVFVSQYPANNPIEDRFAAAQFNNFNGFYAAVFDGHGGWQVAEYAKEKLHGFLDEELKRAKGSEGVKKAILAAFDRVENEFLSVARISFKNGFPNAAYVGACALTAVVHENKLYVANAGDCKAVLFRRRNDGQYEFIKMSKTFSANKKSEQDRLREQFKKEKDIINCKHPKACYVKGKLMPTRSFGDFKLKYPEFNYHTRDAGQGYRTPIEEFTGPYITHVPDIKEIELTKNDEYLVLASDGLWDELKAVDALNVIQATHDNQEQVGEALFNAAIAKVLEERGLTKDFLFGKPPGREKRRIHDDITIVVVNLKNQT